MENVADMTEVAKASSTHDWALQSPSCDIYWISVCSWGLLPCRVWLSWTHKVAGLMRDYMSINNINWREVLTPLSPVVRNHRAVATSLFHFDYKRVVFCIALWQQKSQLCSEAKDLYLDRLPFQFLLFWVV